MAQNDPNEAQNVSAAKELEGDDDKTAATITEMSGRIENVNEMAGGIVTVAKDIATTEDALEVEAAIIETTDADHAPGIAHRVNAATSITFGTDPAAAVAEEAADLVAMATGDAPTPVNATTAARGIAIRSART